MGAIIFVKMLGFQVTPLLAGLGVGGLAFGLAAQDTLKNFFGSVNVVLDRPFQVGDWVKMGDVEGTVESVGLRSSRIRTFYNSQITVPNSEIMTTEIDNLGRRRYRRISCMISVTYDTPPEKLEAFCAGIRALIREHPYTRRDYYHTWVNKFAASSIDILLYCFHECPDWGHRAARAAPALPGHHPAGETPGRRVRLPDTDAARAPRLLAARCGARPAVERPTRSGRGHAARRRRKRPSSSTRPSAKRSRSPRR